MYCKLIDAIDVPMNLRVVYKENGFTKYSYMRFTPGKKYQLPEDEVLLSSLRSAKDKKRYTVELEERLKKLGIDYEIVSCKSCGGRVQKIEYHVVEVIE